MAAQARGSYWIATHLSHHSHSDTYDDPHSPMRRTTVEGEAEELTGLKGLWHAHQGNTLTAYPTNVSRFAARFVSDQVFRNIDAQFPYWVAAGVIIQTPRIFLHQFQWTVVGFVTHFLTVSNPVAEIEIIHA